MQLIKKVFSAASSTKKEANMAYLAHIDRHRPTFQLFLFIPFDLEGILINSYLDGHTQKWRVELRIITAEPFASGRHKGHELCHTRKHKMICIEFSRCE
jgi:hypothetical protein